MQAHTAADDEAVAATARWEDIDAELSCSTREVCIGYGSLPPADAMAVLRDVARRRRERPVLRA